ncbi:MAG: MBL fold metallo-hydrolase [Planctomycetota bacterium]|jgi:glyoxylase-like metal-dependent hydrolase (beta-lactamase superfamily II)
MSKTGWANVVPCIEAIAPGLEAVVIPSGASPWLSEAMPVRAYLLETRTDQGTELILIDTGYATRLSIEAVSTAIAGRKVAVILLTHRHPDHGGGAAALAARHSAPVRASALDSDAYSVDRNLQVAPLSDGDTVTAGDITLRVIASPGHTRGGLAFYDEARGWLYTGDTVLGEGTVVVGPPDGSLRQYMRSLEHLRSLEGLTRLLPGHGDPVDKPQTKITSLLRHRRMRIAQIEGLLAEGPRSCEAIVETLYKASVPEHLLGLARVSVLGTLGWLVEEGRASQEGETFTHVT